MDLLSVFLVSLGDKMSSRAEDLSCPICHDTFTDPVILSCSHSFCSACLQRWWTEKKTLECPFCKRRSSKSDPPRNLALKNLCEGKEQTQRLCSLHSEKLKIFCLDHQEPVCIVCRDSKTHKNHQFRPVDEVAQDQREELQKSLKLLREKLTLLQEFRGDCDQTVKFIKVQSQKTEQQIREQFQKLRLFLQQEEKVRVAALRNEEEAAEKELKDEDISFLQNYKAEAKRVQQHASLDNPESVSGVLIDVVKHLGNLTYNIWTNMKQTVSYSPLILDPNTADPELLVLDDLSGVSSGERQQLPRNQERTEFSCSVVDSEGFNSGTHSWGVDVGQNQDWELGVLGRDLPVNGRMQYQLWRILFFEGKFTAFSASEPEKHLPVSKTVTKIRVLLDFDRGKLSFSDYDTNTNIHTFTHNFTNTLFPYIYTENPLCRMFGTKRRKQKLLFA
uniref:Uncharacterized protein n=1 Tax=Kryptolebias marmoratus TaxID=37003 RepID=A0A3Q3GE70_KRYMA